MQLTSNQVPPYLSLLSCFADFFSITCSALQSSRFPSADTSLLVNISTNLLDFEKSLVRVSSSKDEPRLYELNWDSNQYPKFQIISWALGFEWLWLCRYLAWLQTQHNGKVAKWHHEWKFVKLENVKLTKSRGATIFLVWEFLKVKVPQIEFLFSIFVPVRNLSAE